jgi:hypothetical protein
MAVGVSNQASDQHHFVPILERIVTKSDQLPANMIADAGYCSTSNIEASEQRGLDAYLSTSRLEHSKWPRPSRGPAPRDLDARGRMDRKLRSKAGQAIYALRKIIVEPVFGQIKGARGLDRFLLRGLEKVDSEWALMAITHNIGKLHRAALAASRGIEHRLRRLSPETESSAQNSTKTWGERRSCLRKCATRS